MSFFNLKQKSLIIGTIAVSLCIGLYTVGKVKPTLLENAVGGAVTPFNKAYIKVTDFFAGKADYFKGIEHLQAENSDLKDELLLARAETNRLQNVEKENKELYSLLKMKSYFTAYETVGAKIISRDATNWSNTFLIDLGSDDGIKKNMPVISANGLVGKISECYATYSRVTTITDSTDSISAQIARTNENGYVTGDTVNKDLCRIKTVNETADILDGDEIITSDLSDIYPAGIMIGRITLSDDEDEKGTALIEPAVDIDHIENVLVLKISTSADYDYSTPETTTEAQTEATTVPATEATTENEETTDEVTTEEIPDFAMEPATSKAD